MNRKSLLRPTMALIVLTVLGSRVDADPPGVANLAIGDKAPDFNLPGVDGKGPRPEGFRRRQGPRRRLHLQPLPHRAGLREAVRRIRQGVSRQRSRLRRDSPNDPKAVRLDELGYTDLDDSFESMKIRAKESKITYPYLYDGDTQKVAQALRRAGDPARFHLRRDRKLRYVGRWDDSEVKTVKSHDAINAVEALLAGKPVPVEKTRVTGCSTKWAEKQADAKTSLEKWDAEPVTLETLKDADVAALVKNDGKTLRLVNLWATWCGPCVAELPELVTINRM